MAKTVVPALIIHGGAGGEFKSKFRQAALRRKIEKILHAAYHRLTETTALEAAVFAVQLLEDDPAFNAGTGSMLQADGAARMSASVMDGKTRDFAAVINIERVRNPVLVARALLLEKYRILAAEGANRFARELGFPSHDVTTRRSLSLWKRKLARGSDTVGACALDAAGRLASATSTGGRGMETPGRVSDSGTPAANFATPLCAVSATGHGEDIINEGLAVRIAQKAEDGTVLSKAFRDVFREIRQRRRWIGAIGLDPKGKAVHLTTTDVLIYGWRRGGRSKIF